jgi:release factor glutamine methyltransferase
VRDLARQFEAAGIETPLLDARLLVMAAAGMSRESLVTAPEQMLMPAVEAQVAAFARRRLAREPVSRILGRRSFHGLSLEISPETLDPRPDTETLVDGVLALYRAGQIPGGAAPRILDLGTGTGAILIALLAAIPAATGLATDISREALAVAARNAAAHGVGDRMTVQCAAWLEGIEGLFDLVVSNPPYIAERDAATLAPEVIGFDPAAALFGGADGLDAYREIVSSVPRVLAPAGWLVLEVGAEQHMAVAGMCRSTERLVPENPSLLWRDLGGHVRCVAARSRC